MLVSGIVTLMLSGCTSSMSQLSNNGMLGSLTGAAPAETTKEVTATKVANTNCIPRMGGGSISTWSMVSKMALTPLIESAIQEATGMKDLKIPTPILNTCEADARLKYVDTVTNNYYQNLNDVNNKILDALEDTKEVRELRAELAENETVSEKAALNDGIAEQNEKILDHIESAKVKDKQKISEAWGMFMTAVPKNTALIVGWDKEIAEFAKDNLPWAIKNIGAVKTALSQVKTLAMVASNGKTAMDKLITRNDITIDKKSADKAAKAMEVSNKKMMDESQDQFQVEFDSVS